jgi:carboxymethylenebutenolidase
MPTSDHITIPTPDGEMPAFSSSPDDAARGALIVVQEAFGVTSHIEHIVERLAEEGYYSVAPAFFHRQGAPVLAYDDLESVMPIMGQLTGDGITTDLNAAFEHFESAGFAPSATGIVGFCMGGAVTFYAATLRALGGAVSFYGGGVSTGRFGLESLIDQAPKLQSPWLGLYGDLDQGIPTSEVEQLREATGAAPVPTEIIRYPEAQHGFNCNDRPDVFNQAAAADAWGRTLTWFDHHLAGTS